MTRDDTLRRAVAECMRRGHLTKQQGRTILGQIRHGDYDGACRGLMRLMGRDDAR